MQKLKKGQLVEPTKAQDYFPVKIQPINLTKKTQTQVMNLVCK